MIDKKTPGPWEAKTFVDNRKHGGDHHTFLITPQRGTYGTMFEEDAILAASAPELLEALKPFASIAERILAEAPHETTEFCLFVDCEGCKHLVSLDGLRAAILSAAKAEGAK